MSHVLQKTLNTICDTALAEVPSCLDSSSSGIFGNKKKKNEHQNTEEGKKHERGNDKGRMNCSSSKNASCRV